MDRSSPSSLPQIHAGSSPAATLLEPLRTFVAARVSVDGPPRIEVVACAAGCSVRTLQRRLGEAGTTYSRLLEEVRLATAARMLQVAESKVIEVALDLGYSDQANFTRAFRRWAGVPPSQFRRMRRNETDDGSPLLPACEEPTDADHGWSTE